MNQLAQPTIAILEDEPLMLETLKDVFETSGMPVVHATTRVRDFLTGVRLHTPNVAVIDLRIVHDPARDAAGEAAMIELRRIAPEVKTLVFSASDNPQSVERCLSLGAHGYLFKHTTQQADVVEAVRAISAGQKIVPISSFPAPSSEPEAPTDRTSPVRSLTARELEVLRFVTSGSDNLKIAAHLEITERTVKAHLANLYRKLAVDNRTQLALKARELGIAPLRER